jgi:hypothetical protein
MNAPVIYYRHAYIRVGEALLESKLRQFARFREDFSVTPA